MKEILHIRIKELIEQSNEDTLIHFLGELQSNLNSVQKNVIKHRVRMLWLIGIFVLLVFKFITLKNFPGFTAADIAESLKGVFPTIDDILIYLIPLIFAVQYYFLIINLLYRSQLRDMHSKLYEVLYPTLFAQKLYLYTLPHSPGHIMKVAHRIKHRGKPEKERSNDLIKVLRNIGIYLERGLHLFFIAFAIYCLFLKGLAVEQESRQLIFSIIFPLTFITAAFFVYALRVLAEYNNSFNSFDDKIEAFKSNPNIDHSPESVPPPPAAPDN